MHVVTAKDRGGFKMAEELKSELEEARRQLQAQQLQLARDQQSFNSQVNEFRLQSASTRQPQTVIQGTLGSLKEFAMQDDWGFWCERLEQFFYCQRHSNREKSGFVSKTTW